MSTKEKVCNWVFVFITITITLAVAVGLFILMPKSFVRTTFGFLWILGSCACAIAFEIGFMYVCDHKTMTTTC